MDTGEGGNTREEGDSQLARDCIVREVVEARSGERSGDSLRASIRGWPHTPPHAGDLPATSSCSALWSVHPDFVSFHLHGAHSSVARARPSHLRESRRVRSLLATQHLWLRPATARGQVFADPECSASDDDLLSRVAGLACGDFLHSCLYARFGVPRGCLGNELVVLAERHFLGLLREIFGRV